MVSFRGWEGNQSGGRCPCVPAGREEEKRRLWSLKMRETCDHRNTLVSKPIMAGRKSCSRRLLTLLAGAKLREPRKLMMTGQRKIISPNPKRGEYHRWSVGSWEEGAGGIGGGIVLLSRSRCFCDSGWRFNLRLAVCADLIVFSLADGEDRGRGSQSADA